VTLFWAHQKSPCLNQTRLLSAWQRVGTEVPRLWLSNGPWLGPTIYDTIWVLSYEDVSGGTLFKASTFSASSAYRRGCRWLEGGYY
jgi:hypothetical protein